jgi:predicted nucleic acid-binding protein
VLGILIDTNILIYASVPWDIAKQDLAIHLLRHLELTASGCLSVQCLAEFINATTRSVRPLYTHAEALVQVEHLVSTYPVFNLTPLIVMEAARAARDYSLAYYDAQIWATARLNQIPTVFSEDFQDGQVLEGVQFINPFAAGFMMEAWGKSR